MYHHTNQLLFTKSGTYAFIMGEDLHIDDPSILDKVLVHYTHHHNPATPIRRNTPGMVRIPATANTSSSCASL